MNGLEMTTDWILGTLTDLFIPAVLWAALLAGLIELALDRTRRSQSAKPQVFCSTECRPTSCRWGCVDPELVHDIESMQEEVECT